MQKSRPVRPESHAAQKQSFRVTWKHPAVFEINSFGSGGINFGQITFNQMTNGFVKNLIVSLEERCWSGQAVLSFPSLPHCSWLEKTLQKNIPCSILWCYHVLTHLFHRAIQSDFKLHGNFQLNISRFHIGFYYFLPLYLFPRYVQ